jgi:HEPN domain-containing protein
MSGSDPNHWLRRLSPEDWLQAAENELLRARHALHTKQQRPGVAGARRAAGMAWNAVLSIAPDEAYGRSYMDHLKAMATDATVPETIRDAARQLVAAPLETKLVQLGAGDEHLADAAAAIVAHARNRLKPTVSA